MFPCAIDFYILMNPTSHLDTYSQIALEKSLEDISEVYKYGKITLEDYNEMLSVIPNLNNYFI